MPSLHNHNWELHDVAHCASKMHARDLISERGIWNVVIGANSMVLGSSQTEAVVDRAACERVGVDVVHRRSGGGAVYLAVGEHIWVDVVIPRADPLWDDDVVTSPIWLGDAWARALSALGESNVEVHRSMSLAASWSKLICFAGVGPGEVLINGAKAVGISQRRNREAARFQCIMHSRWAPEVFVPLLVEPRPAIAEISSCVTTLKAQPSQLLAAFVAELQTL